MTHNECTKVQNLWHPHVHESCLYNVHARMLEKHVRLNSRLVLYTAGSTIALTRAVPMLVLPHAVTAGASLYIEQEHLIAGKPE